jgi:hypothetical protein
MRWVLGCVCVGGHDQPNLSQHNITVYLLIQNPDTDARFAGVLLDRLHASDAGTATAHPRSVSPTISITTIYGRCIPVAFPATEVLTAASRVSLCSRVVDLEYTRPYIVINDH